MPPFDIRGLFPPDWLCFVLFLLIPTLPVAIPAGLRFIIRHVRRGSGDPASAPLSPGRRHPSADARLVMLLILALIFGGASIVIIVPLRQALTRQRVESTTTMIRSIASAVVAFRAEQCRLPRGLDELVGDYGYLDSDDVPTDAWGNAFVYETRGDQAFNLISLGADGREGGDGEDADIVRGGPPRLR